MSMKFLKTLVWFLSFLLVLSVIKTGQAMVTGECSNCHTMHNSQNGSPVARDDSGSVTETPQEVLLMYSCLGCHTSSSTSTWKDPNTKAPIVWNTAGTNYGYNNEGLAAGNFYNVLTSDNTGHNVLAANNDETLGNRVPPGGSVSITKIHCAGTEGCHGNRTATNQIIDLKGAHHTIDITIDGTTVGKSYRFLKEITGVEDDDWEQETTTDHNWYKGSVGSSDTSTISHLCSECHGNFHSQDSSGIGTQSPWVRHPTDSLLPQTGEYSVYDPASGYSVKAPTAWTDPASPTRATAVVMCLSCHRAHASPYFKMVRWDIKSGTLATALSGCNVCHTSKN
jgi:predicted CXXCH cytochrome family protein